MIYDNKFRKRLLEQNIDITKCKKISFLKDKNLDHPIINYNPDTKSLKIIDSKPIFFTDETKFKDFEDLEELILYNINTNNITTMNEMFYNCCSLKKLDLSNFNTPKLKDTYGMFWYCKSLENTKELEYHLENNTIKEYYEDVLQEEFLDYACPIIRDILNDMGIYDVSSSEVDDIGRDLLLEIDLDNFNEETFYSLLGDYLETYDIEKENKQDDYDID